MYDRYTNYWGLNNLIWICGYSGEVSDEYGDTIIHGPDFDEFFRENTSLLGDDGVHPSFDGYEAMRRLWAETMYSNVYTAKQSGNNTSSSIKGDVNADGKFTVTDVVTFQKWLLAIPDVKLSNWQAADLCEDGRLNVFDLCVMKRLLVESTSFSPVIYEAENAAFSGKSQGVDKS